MKKLTIIDGCAFLFRAYYATLKNNYLYTKKNNIPINAVYGFINMVNRIISNLDNNECIFVGFDSIKKSFRKNKFKDYKANRPLCPEDLKIQISIAHEFLDAMSIIHYEIDHFEGDDICGSIAKIASQNDYEVTIYTSDHDFFQLIDNHIKIKLIKIGLSKIQEINQKNIYDLYGFYANQLVDFKGLAGDKSDNLPGIPLIGEKIAKKLLNEYKNFENIVNHAKEIKSPKISENIIKYQEQGKISKELAAIKTDLTFPFSINDLKYNGFLFEKIYNFFQKYELENFLKHLPDKFRKENIDLNNIVVKKVNDLPRNEKYQVISLFLDLEKKNQYIKNIIIGSNETIYTIDNQHILKAKKLKQILKNPNIKKYVFNYAEIKQTLSNLNIDLLGLSFDLLLAVNLLNNSFKNFISVAKNFNINLNEDANNYAIKCAFLMFNLKNKITEILIQKKMYDFFITIEMPFYEIITNIKNNRVLIQKKRDKKKENKNLDHFFLDISNYIQQNFNNNDDYLCRFSNLNFSNNLIYYQNKQKFNLNHFIQNKNFYFMLFEYSQIEFEILAVLSESQEIIQLLKQKKNIYKKILISNNSNIIKNKECQNIINLSIIQGINTTKVAQILNINKVYIDSVINFFYKSYPEIKNYFKNIILNINQKNDIKTFFNRLIYWKNKNFNINFQIRETIIDIIKKIIIKIYCFIKEKKLKSQLLMQTNYRLIFKINKNEKIVNQIKKIMESDINLPIKLKVLTKKYNFF